LARDASARRGAKAEAENQRLCLDCANPFARWAGGVFFEETSALPKAPSKHDRYEALTRVADLIWQLPTVCEVNRVAESRTREASYARLTLLAQPVFSVTVRGIRNWRR
jgi:hypothetical protein